MWLDPIPPLLWRSSIFKSSSLSFLVDLDTPSNSRDLITPADTKPGIILGGLYSTIALSKLTISVFEVLLDFSSMGFTWADLLALLLKIRFDSFYSRIVSISETSGTDLLFVDYSAVLDSFI